MVILAVASGRIKFYSLPTPTYLDVMTDLSWSDLHIECLEIQPKSLHFHFLTSVASIGTNEDDLVTLVQEILKSQVLQELL